MQAAPSTPHLIRAGLILFLVAIAPLAEADQFRELHRKISQKEHELKGLKMNIKIYQDEIAEDSAALAKVDAEIALLERMIKGGNPNPSPARPDTRHDGLTKRDDRLIPMTNEAREAMIRVMHAGNMVGTGFVTELKGKKVILCPIHLVNAHKKLSFVNHQGETIETGSKVLSPRGIPLIGFEATRPLEKTLELCSPTETAKASDAVFVLMVSNRSQRAEGYQCVIRGVGPDVYEVEGYVDRSMLGCPVISMNSSKVIGFINETVDGVSALWAQGTRHQKARYFVARADLFKDSTEVELARIHRESDWLQDYQLEVHLAGTCLRYLQGRVFQHDSETVNQHSDHSIVKGLRQAQRDRLKGSQESARPYCVKIVQSLKTKSKMSGNFTWNNGQIYQANLKQAQQLIEGFKKEGGIRD